MKKNLLKIQLFIAFICTIFSFTTFYYGNDLPDNMFSITSSNNASFISYYFFSVVTFISYFSGPWFLIPFVAFSLSMTFLYNRREYLVDTLNFFPLIFACAGLTYFIYPNALGFGLQQVFNSYFDKMWLSIYILVALPLFFFGTFRSSFKESLIATWNFLKSLPARYSKMQNAISGKFKSNARVATESRSAVESKLTQIMRSSGKDEKPLFISTPKKDQKEVRDDNIASEAMSKFKSMIPNVFSKEAKDSKDSKVSKQSNEDITENRNIFTKESLKSSSELNSENSAIEANPFGFDLGEESSGSVSDTSFTGDLAGNSQAVTREKKVIMVSDFKALNKLADTTQDNKYFDIVSTLSDTRDAKQNREPDSEYFEQIIGLLEAKLSEFKIEGNIVNVLKGPVVDTFEFKPGAGVKVSKISNATEDLSLALYGVPIRVVPSMMGRDTVGIEVPRNPREIIYLDEVLNSKDFQSSDYALPIAMGKDAFGEPFVMDLTNCPHMLVAGATGAGKSVFINSLLVSLLIKKSPKKMKLILIDPKQLELALYSKLPHLVMPVITDAKTASVALLWAVQEMERRYSILKEFGVRNISGFNEKLEKATPSMLANIHQYYEDQGVEDYELPYLVVIVDEFADLILTKAGKEIENNIARLAAKARAAGIHLILATQRPSVDVITGVIKSNFPTRVSFRVTSQMDSRTILDKIGAERLLGKGDMLYKHGISTQRVHSSFVNEDEIEALTDKLAEIPSEFNENAMNFLETGGEVETDEYTYGSHIPTSSDSSDDELYNEALKIVMESRSASASMLQRRLRIGYNRAANLVEEMERRGVVGPAQGAKPRKVLQSIDEAQF